ncbi:heterokaryon incompatibility protein-domain-containing protein [Xylariales sp. PMI_506]|nr:heterokaryon incompatibility protein-domain-containing protein [Xylariales sp. PMI_506]
MLCFLGFTGRLGRKALVPITSIPFTYEPLVEEDHQIRVVTILPGEYQDPIQLQIDHISLNIASVHGDPSSKVSHPEGSHTIDEVRRTLPHGWRVHQTITNRLLFCDNEGNSTWDHPTDKQWDPGAAIRYLRYADESRTMWIDSICINQDDEKERGKQVVRMGETYGLATRVIAWLGRPFRDFGLSAFSIIDYIGQQVEVTQDGHILRAPGCQQPTWVSQNAEVPCDRQVFMTLAQLFDQPWFSRVWVLQEIHLGGSRATLRWGHDEMPWQRFRNAVYFINSRKMGTLARLQNHLIWASRAVQDLSSYRFERLVSTIASCHCTEPKDKIYAKLVPVEVPAGKKSLTTMSVFKDVFLAYSNMEKRLSLLQCCYHLRYHSNEGTEDWQTKWSTWIPDWVYSERPRFPTHPVASASSFSAGHFHYRVPGVLEVSGVHLTTISSVENLMGKAFKISRPGSNSGRVLEVAAYLEGLGLEGLGKAKYFTGETLLDAYLQTMAIGYLQDRWSDPAYPTLKQWRQEVYEIVRSGRRIQQEPMYSEKGSWQPSPWQSVAAGDLNKHTMGHRFEYSLVDDTQWASGLAKTEHGYLVAGHTNMRAGDIISIILGCSYPMCLRPSAATVDGSYEIIGPCYVHGFMDGEALIGPLSEPWAVRYPLSADRGGRSPEYYHRDTAQDPRLDEIPLPDGWEAAPVPQRQREDPVLCCWYRNRDTGEVINSDPRLAPEALKARGVPVEVFSLI